MSSTGLVTRVRLSRTFSVRYCKTRYRPPRRPIQPWQSNRHTTVNPSLRRYLLPGHDLNDLKRLRPTPRAVLVEALNKVQSPVPHLLQIPPPSKLDMSYFSPMRRYNEHEHSRWEQPPPDVKAALRSIVPDLPSITATVIENTAGNEFKTDPNAASFDNHNTAEAIALEPDEPAVESLVTTASQQIEGLEPKSEPIQQGSENPSFRCPEDAIAQDKSVTDDQIARVKTGTAVNQRPNDYPLSWTNAGNAEQKSREYHLFLRLNAAIAKNKRTEDKFLKQLESGNLGNEHGHPYANRQLQIPTFDTTLQHKSFPEPFHNSKIDLEHVESYMSWVALQEFEEYIDDQDSELAYIDGFETDSVDQTELCFKGLSKRQRHYLSIRGYTLEEVELWAQIIQEPEIERAASLTIQSLKNSHSLPLFILNFLLIRKDISLLALRDILRSAEMLLERTHPHPARSENQVFILFVRLLRHARSIWPEVIPHIATIIPRALEQSKVQTSGVLSKETISRLIIYYNRMLEMLSLPSPIRPFVTSGLQETAQFRVLEAMSSYTPRIHITHTGFRAVIRLQLMQPKTEQERDWAGLKSPSWPPWKISKNRMDEDKGLEHGKSRAYRAIAWMREAGYASQWDAVARIYAGWDTDSTPTIQTRKIIPRRQSIQSHPNPSRSPSVWAARIDVSRNIREAWAMFLECEAQAHFKPHWLVYEAIFTKHALETQRLSSRHPMPSDLLPGDALVTFPSPTSPMERLYLKEEVPTFERLLDRMYRAGLRPFGRFLHQLLSNSPSLRTAVQIWSRSEVGLESKSNSPEMQSRVAPLHTAKIPGVFEALCQYPTSREGRSLFSVSELINPQGQCEILLPLFTRTLPTLQNPHELALYQAFYLLLSVNDKNPKNWHTLLKAVLRTRDHEAGLKTNTPLVTLYPVVIHILTLIEEKFKRFDARFLAFFAFYVNAAGAVAVRLSQGSEERDLLGWKRKRHGIAQRLLSEAAPLLRQIFRDAVGSDLEAREQAQSAQSLDTTIPVPCILNTPAPVTLHAYIRSLGLLGDHEGILEFVNWAADHEGDLLRVIKAEHSGAKRWEQTRRAIRAILERPGDVFAKYDRFQGMLRPPELAPAPFSMIHQVGVKMDDMTKLGPWPSAKEAKEYILSSFEIISEL